jgi:hypothetical protein
VQLGREEFAPETDADHTGLAFVAGGAERAIA